MFHKKNKNSVRNIFLKAYVYLIITMLVLNAVVIWQTYLMEYENVLNLQGKKLENIEIRIKNYVNNIENEIKVTAEINNILKQDINQKYKIISGLLSFHSKSNKDVFNELMFLDSEGKEIVHVSRINAYLGSEHDKRYDSEEFRTAKEKGETCYSRIFFNDKTGEPSVNMAIPVPDIQEGITGAVIIAEIRLRDIWNFIEETRLDSEDNIYVLDDKGKVVVHNSDVSVVLKGTLFYPPEKYGIQKGLFGSEVFMSERSMSLGGNIVHIVIERPVIKAFNLVSKMLVLYLFMFIAAVIVHVFIKMFFNRRIIQPVESLSGVAKAINSGELSVKAEENNTSEFGVLAATFNKMTSRMIETIGSLKQRVEERDKANKELEAAHRRFLTVLDSLDSIVYAAEMETYEILFINKYAQKIFGDTGQKKCWQVFNSKNDSFCDFCNNKKLINGGNRPDETYTYEFQSAVNSKWYYAQDKAIRWVDGRTVRMTIATDITERKNFEDAIKFHAYHDPLTGLPNRMLFLEHLTLEMSRTLRNKNKLAVLFLDLDRFKNINDSLGHTVGDHLLKEVSKRFKTCIRTSDTVSRIGGDEFNIMLEDINSTDNIIVSAKKILAVFDTPFVIDGNELYISASIGISIFPDNGVHVEDLMRNADVAMYTAKEKGRNNFQFYNPEMDLKTIEKVILRKNLRQASERGELVIYYQPQVDISTEEIAGAEALIRWQHPELGLLHPNDFLFVAEETGFIKFVDTWVLNEACRQNKEWQNSGFRPFCITVNLSVPQFQRSDLVDIVSDALKNTGLDPEYLNLEITENVVLRDIELSMPNITKLNNMGVRFFIDDFGIGYSSLSWFKKFQIQKLKVDKSFIDDITVNPNSKAIITAVIAMAHNLKMKVIAEGVETREQFECLRGLGCDEVQGFIISRPVTAEEFKKLIE